MSYFLHNKYDAISIAMLPTIGNATVIDFYSLLETNYEQYKWLDVSSMPSIVSTLTYYSPVGSRSTHPILSDSLLDLSSSLFIKKIQTGTVLNSVTVNIAEVVPGKTMVIVNGGTSSYPAYLTCIKPKYIQVSGSGNISYQVIEFK